MSPQPSSHINALRLAPTLRGYAEGLSSDKNEAHFLVHAALLTAFSAPGAPVASTEAGLRADIARRAARAGVAWSAAQGRRP